MRAVPMACEKAGVSEMLTQSRAKSFRDRRHRIKKLRRRYINNAIVKARFGILFGVTRDSSATDIICS